MHWNLHFNIDAFDNYTHQEYRYRKVVFLQKFFRASENSCHKISCIIIPINALCFDILIDQQCFLVIFLQQ